MPQKKLKSVTPQDKTKKETENKDSLHEAINYPTFTLNDSSLKNEEEKTPEIFNPDSLKKNYPAIEFPKNESLILKPFFESLNNKNARIFHYGDSQIEGDRITSYLRNFFQKKFGGSGFGFIPVKNIPNHHVTINIEVSDNISHYNVRDWKKFERGKRNFGASLYFSETKRNDTGSFNSSIRINLTGTAYAKARYFNTIKIYYSSNSDSSFIDYHFLKDSTVSKKLKKGSAFNSISFETRPGLKSFLFKIRSNSEVKINGASFENTYGIQADNFAVRGSGGLEFFKPDKSSILSMMNVLSPDLIVLQYGVNIVPSEYESYKFYENALYKQLLYLKHISKNTPILIAGVSDMGKIKNKEVLPYKSTEKVREAQKKAAFRAGCAFWDTYSAMGGKNSIEKWVNHNPPLATKDYTHFNYRGSLIIAEMLSKAIYDNYNKMNK